MRANYPNMEWPFRCSDFKIFRCLWHFLFGISCSVHIADVVGKSRVKNSRAVRQLTAGSGWKGAREELTEAWQRQKSRLQRGGRVARHFLGCEYSFQPDTWQRARHTHKCFHLLSTQISVCGRSCDCQMKSSTNIFGQWGQSGQQRR